MKRTVAGFAAGAFAIVAVATAPLATAGPDADFLSALARAGLTVPAASTMRTVSAGHAVCAGFASGDSYKDATADIAGALGGNRSLAGTFVSAAASSLCPNYLSKIP
jgi:Protein of unknown function (DUF732)